MTNYRTAGRVTPAPAVNEGEGVLVHRAFPNRQLEELDPFLLLDHMGPSEFRPGEAKGFPDHPHRGFETVTYLLEGEFQHRDSFGHQGTLHPGDVQWMTAGSGLVHSETPGASLVRNGGRLQGFQLWINLPRRDKMKPPHYQEIAADRIPRAVSADGKVQIKVIAGESLGVKGGVNTHLPIQYLHVRLDPGGEHTQEIARGLNAMAYVFAGEAQIGGKRVPEFHLAALEDDGEAVQLASSGGAQLLLLAGQPIREPVERYGPFVMNTREELRQAFEDYRAGRMGVI